jgi:hypothetical protein
MTDHILNNISKMLRGDFSSFDAVHDERVRPPQEAPGTITKAVAARIALPVALKENCISIAVRTVEGDGVMAGTPEVAAKLQQMDPEPAPGFEYNFAKEIAETFVEDDKLGPAPSYQQATASTV